MLTDLISPNLSVVFCGINPGLKSASNGHHFSGRSNRFWKVLHQSGFTPHEIEAKNGATILNYGYGLTTAVERATARADELLKDEFDHAIEIFEAKIRMFQPKYIAFLGKAAYMAFLRKNKFHGDFRPKHFAGQLFGYYLIRVV